MSVPLSSGLLFSPVTHAHVSKNSCFFLSHSFSPPQHSVLVSWVQKRLQVSEVVLTRVFQVPFCSQFRDQLLLASVVHILTPSYVNDQWWSPVWCSRSRYRFSLLLCRWAYSPGKTTPKANRLAGSSVYVGGLLTGTWDPLMP